MPGLWKELRIGSLLGYITGTGRGILNTTLTRPGLWQETLNMKALFGHTTHTGHVNIAISCRLWYMTQWCYCVFYFPRCILGTTLIIVEQGNLPGLWLQRQIYHEDHNEDCFEDKPSKKHRLHNPDIRRSVQWSFSRLCLHHCKLMWYTALFF